MLVGIFHPSVPVRCWIKAESKLLFFTAWNNGAVQSDTAHIRTNYSKLRKGIATFFRKNNFLLLLWYVKFILENRIKLYK
ncbi:hypothetical protein DJ93_4008 [Bacillus clarus]|uniref:Uncharacterized protein n=1 Tax=Bacillus clarus TaxID=2338372 RepID=A0A090Z1T6_9BACI|nr:hypothetical protein DJ93_4008 [Bacillus clarus]